MCNFADAFVPCIPARLPEPVREKIASLRQTVLVSHDSRRVEVWGRSSSDDWPCTVAGSREEARLASIRAAIDVAEL